MISETVVISTILYTQRVVVTVTDKSCHYRYNSLRLRRRLRHFGIILPFKIIVHARIDALVIFRWQRVHRQIIPPFSRICLSHLPEMIVIQLESSDRHTQLLKVVARYVTQIRVRHSQGDLLLGGEFAAQCFGQLVKRLHLLTQHLDTLPYVVATTTASATAAGIVVRVGDPTGWRGHRHRLVDNGTRKLLLSAGARADLATYGAMETRTGREA